MNKPSIRIPYESLQNIEVIESDSFFPSFYCAGVKLRPDLVLRIRGANSDSKPLAKNAAILLSDALFALYQFRAEEAQFAEAVAKYRAASPKPALTEDLRKYQVQAEFMINQKRFADAVRLYNDALKSAPWWPQGHFNRALILGELKRYREAIREMNRYLQLEPDAPNARAVQDQIYQWEAAAKIGK